MIHELPESFGKLCSLRVCMLSKNHLQWLPSSFGNLSSLEDVRLDDNEVGGEGWLVVLGLTAL